MTEASVQKPSVHRPRHAPATAADVMRPALTTIEPRDHVAAAAYLMKHAGVTAEEETRLRIMPLDCSPGCGVPQPGADAGLGMDTLGGPDPGILDTLGGPGQPAPGTSP
jgi:hypothetical protein